MQKLSAWFGELPGAFFHVAAPPVVFIIGYYALLLLILVGSRARWRRYAIAAIVMCLVGHGLVGAVRNRSTVHITALPLDGGDAIYADKVEGGHKLLIDCGSEDEGNKLVKQFLRASGVNRLDGLVLTHGDKSHVGGFLTLTDRFACRQIITSFVRFRSTFYRAITDELAATESNWSRVARGDRIGFWTVLYPLRDTKASRADDAPLVLSGVIHGFKILLLSDLSRLGLRKLLALEPDLRADILFIDEPWDAGPPNIFFLEMLNPEVVIVTGRPLRSGSRWARELRAELPPTSALYHTGESGAIQLEITPGQCAIATMEGEPQILKNPYERDG